MSTASMLSLRQQLPLYGTDELRRSITDGSDPLGDEYCLLHTPEARRGEGITLTPRALVEAMIDDIVRRDLDIARIVDAGAGTGRFALNAARMFPNARVVAIEKSPTLTAILRHNIATFGLQNRVEVVQKDYRDIALPRIEGRTLYIGNPPYVRHHDIDPDWKRWYGNVMGTLGIKASQLAGLHMHFYAKTLIEASQGDLVSFITAAEWLDVGYGSALRALLLAKAANIELTVFGKYNSAFSDALTTSAICLAEIGGQPETIAVREVQRISDLCLGSGFTSISLDQARSASRWTELFPGLDGRSGAGLGTSSELGEVFEVHRGQVTGMNSVWTYGNYKEPLPSGVLFPAITRAKELLELSKPRLDSDSKLKRVIDLPRDLDELSPGARAAVLRFLRWAEATGARNTYIAQHRKPWYRVGLREPAPIVMTYMARRPPRFVRNLCGARIINIAHGLYPRAALPDRVLDKLTDWLNDNVSVAAGRTYAGGLTKFEPGEVMRLRIPSTEELANN
jgi:SAM-dependent methyltransferase